MRTEKEKEEYRLKQFSKFRSQANEFRSISRYMEYVMNNEEWRTGATIMKAKHYSTLQQYIEKELDSSVDIIRAICKKYRPNVLKLIDEQLEKEQDIPIIENYYFNRKWRERQIPNWWKENHTIALPLE